MGTTSWVEEQFGISGRTAVVTGARTGIGRAAARGRAPAGAARGGGGPRPRDCAPGGAGG